MRVLFLGRGELGLSVLQRLLAEEFEVPVIVTCGHTPEVGGSPKAFKKLAADYGIDYFHTNKINTPEWAKRLQAYNADIGVALLWLYIIKEPIIRTTKHGLLNFHAGDLPKYRGNACINWAILEGEKQIGFSVHLMEPGKLDSGPVVVKDYFALTPETTVGNITKAYLSRGVDMIVEAVGKFALGKAELQSQDEDSALYCYPRLPRDGEIDWNQTSDRIHALIRSASRPFPGAYTYYRDPKRVDRLKKLTIWRTHIEDHSIDFLSQSGHLIKLENGNKWAAATSDGKLLVLDEIEIDDVTVSPAAAFGSIRIRLGIDVSSEIADLRERVRQLEEKLTER
ncbi:MAG: hypothetical protein DRP45_03420 [Candidatus Zixiibacteriota bacterium]|nr:MAG: hypothetical protein DRP45_03420 [candidate division Zixibacteria bacterium]